MTRGLVLGGGGITGIAWMTGLVAGLAEAGVDVRTAEMVVGTSAGSVVGAQLRSGTPVEELYAYQASPYVAKPGEQVASISPSVLARYAVAFLRGRGDSRRMCRALGAYAVAQTRAGRTPTLEERYAAIRERLPSLEWPAEPLVATAVDVATGELRGLDAASGVSLLEAVAASCAVPGVYPPVPLEGRDHVDGGARSYVNADLARDCERVLVLAPVDRAIGPMRRASEQLAGVRHEVVRPDARSRAAIGRNVLDPARRSISAEAGRAQAADVAERVRALWSD
ncbi:patatin-like phospholipase family protein [Nocardioides massiliensis]|uniref:NTE family protein n=1 Tax=Nocardioides massiliensis TaxID=1325935 RepID=A0ABT9NQ47_9ACTN|nr:patatin-like phospholipase family protein [Nocardioides massiliensis]MDP9822299.1 NTE family protein [Nocardioides massiliensis]